MRTNVLLFGWNRSIPGREAESSSHFDDFVAYLNSQKEGGSIENYQVIFLDNHGGDLNGFFLIHGSTDQLDSMCSTDDWHRHTVRAALHLDGFGVVRGGANEAVMKRMADWNEMRPS